MTLRKTQTLLGILTAATLLSASGSHAATLPGTIVPSVWFDASQLSLADGASVAEWTDVSGNNNHAIQNTALRRPLYYSSVAGANDMAVVRFNSELHPEGVANQFLAFPGAVGNTLESDLSIYLVAFDSGVRSHSRANLINTRPNQGTHNGFIFGNASTPDNQSYAHISSSIIDGGPGIQATPIDSTGFNLLGLSRNGLDATVFNYTDTAANASSATWNNFVPSAMSTTQIGTEGGAHYLYGDISEILIFDSILSASDHDLVVQYLGTKYDITSAIPEPSTYALITGCLMLFGAAYIRRKK